MIKICESWEEDKELNGYDPLKKSIEKWEKIDNVLSALLNVYRDSTCALCCKYYIDLNKEKCKDCPEYFRTGIMCEQKGSVWRKAIDALNVALLEARTMKSSLEATYEENK